MSARIGTLPEIPERASSLDGEVADDGDDASADGSCDGDGTNTNRPEQDQLRFANRLRRWHVKFGNPALGTYAGSIVTLHPRSQRRRRLLLGDGYESSDGDTSNDEYDDESSSDVSSVDSFSSCSTVTSLLQDDAPDLDSKRTQRIAVMANVPPHQVPDGVLNLVRSHRPFIEHVRIVIGSSRLEELEYRRQRRRMREMRKQYQEKKENPETERRSRSQTWACENDEVDNGGKNSLGDYLTAPFSATSISKHSDESSDFSSSKMGTRGSRSTSLDLSAHFSYENDLVRGGYNFDNTSGYEEEKHAADENENHLSSDHGNADKNYHILFVLDSEDSAETFVSDLHHRPYTSLDESDTCSVYHAAHVKGEDGVILLGPFFASSTASPNENAPSSPAKDEHQCPVCLETLEVTSSDASSSILTTVCNHSFHIDCLVRWQDSPCPVCRYDHSGLNETLSRCHVCATTVRNYVCLICGVISCSNGPSASTFTPPSTGEGGDQVPSHLGHARRHYEESLHAYALDTETQHVWDFAGGGYVHRLLQNSEDGKIVEGTDPRLMEEERGMNLLNDGGGGGAPSLPLTALERSAIPTYSSSAEDDEATHLKLEGWAGQYYILLKSQLEQQRIFYEGRLEAIRREHEHTTRNERQTTSEPLISALKQERNNLEQRCMTLRRKHKKVSDDAVFLENMNESLEADKHSFRKQIAEAQAELTEAKQLTLQLLTPLEEKVSGLIVDLENGFGGDDVDDRKPSAT